MIQHQKKLYLCLILYLKFNILKHMSKQRNMNSKHVASMILIPMWQYTLFNLEYDEWINDIPSLILNYKLLRCK